MSPSLKSVFGFGRSTRGEGSSSSSKCEDVVGGVCLSIGKDDGVEGCAMKFTPFGFDSISVPPVPGQEKSTCNGNDENIGSENEKFKIEGKTEGKTSPKIKTELEESKPEFGSTERENDSGSQSSENIYSTISSENDKDDTLKDVDLKGQAKLTNHFNSTNNNDIKKDSLSVTINNEERLHGAKRGGGSCRVARSVKNVLIYLYGLFLFAILIVFSIISWVYRQFVRVLLYLCYGKSIHIISRPFDALRGYETDRSSSNIILVLKCEGPADIDRIIDDFERKVLAFRTLRKIKMRTGGGEEQYKMYAPYEKLRWTIRQKLLFYCWDKDTQEDFNVRNHFFMEKVPHLDKRMNGGMDTLDERIEAVCEAYLEFKLDSRRPQWEFRLIAPVGGEGSTTMEYGLIFCVQQTYGDAVSWIEMFRHCFADEKHGAAPLSPLKLKVPQHNDNSSSSSCKTRKNPEPENKSQCKSPKPRSGFFHSLFLSLSLPHQFARRIVKVSREKNQYHGPNLKGSKRCIWLQNEISMDAVKTIKNRMNPPVRLTSVISACVSRAFEKSFDNRKVSKASSTPHEILATVPYVNKPYKSFVPVNNFDVTLVKLPIKIKPNKIPCLHPNEGQARLLQLEKNLRKSTGNYEMEVNRLLTRFAGSFVIPILKRTGNLIEESTVAISNIPGPPEKFTLFGGHVVKNLVLFPPMKNRTAVSLAVTSYCNRLNFTLAVDGTIAEKFEEFPDLFLQYLQEEIDDLSKYKEPEVSQSNSRSSTVRVEIQEEEVKPTNKRKFTITNNEEIISDLEGLK